jgi:hypothetical protein
MTGLFAGVLFSIKSSPEPDNNIANDATEPKHPHSVIVFGNEMRILPHPVISPSRVSSVPALGLAFRLLS